MSTMEDFCYSPSDLDFLEQPDESDWPTLLPPLFGDISLMPCSPDPQQAREQTLIAFNTPAVLPRGLPTFSFEPQETGEQVCERSLESTPASSPSLSFSSHLLPSSPPASSSPLVLTPSVNDPSSSQSDAPEPMSTVCSAFLTYPTTALSPEPPTDDTANCYQRSDIETEKGKRTRAGEATSSRVRSHSAVRKTVKDTGKAKRCPSNWSKRASDPRACKQNWEQILQSMQLTNGHSLKGKWYWHLRAEKERLEQASVTSSSSSSSITRTSITTQVREERTASSKQLLPARSRLGSLYQWIQTAPKPHTEESS